MTVEVRPTRSPRARNRRGTIRPPKLPTRDGPDMPLRMTEEEFVRWCDEDVRAEWVDGRVIIMSPDSLEHSNLFIDLGAVLRLFVQSKDLGIVVGPNMQIRLSSRRRRVPDLLFVAKDRMNILRENHVEGAPDAASEIVSPDSIERDWREKYLEYEAAGVREYWIIDPSSEQVRQHRLDEHGRYQSIEPEGGLHRSEVIPGFWIREENLWEGRRISGLKWLKAMGVK